LWPCSLDREPFSLSNPLPAVKASLGDYWRAASMLMRDSYKKKELVVVHVPQTRVKQLKAEVLGECRLFCERPAYAAAPSPACQGERDL